MPAPTTVTLYRGISTLLLSSVCARQFSCSRPEALRLGLERIAAGQPGGEAQKARVGHHSVRGPQAAPPDRPASLHDLDRLKQPEPPLPPKRVPETLHPAHPGTVGAND